METISTRKKGPVPGPVTEKYNLLLEPDLAEWAKQQPGGMSETVRKLLKEAYQNSSPKG